MESPVFIEEIKVKKHFDYVVGIGIVLYILRDKNFFNTFSYVDLGTYSTSVSFSHSDDDDLQTMTVWYVFFNFFCI
jgi:hypothetical protein